MAKMDWKSDTMKLSALSLGTVAGVGIAKVLSDKALSPLLRKDGAELFPFADAVAGVIPLGIGVAVYGLGARKMADGPVRDVVVGSAVGMVALGLGKIVSRFVPAAKDFTLNGLGGDVYDYSLGGYGPVSSYMMNGSPFSADYANPMLNGAVVDIQQAGLGMAPTSASIVGTGAPLNTALVA